ncbi:MAG: hypothetical protein AAGI66_08860 [Cyanobacteria bacterium P01_H01_bin.74]
MTRQNTSTREITTFEITTFSVTVPYPNSTSKVSQEQNSTLLERIELGILGALNLPKAHLIRWAIVNTSEKDFTAEGAVFFENTA